MPSEIALRTLAAYQLYKDNTDGPKHAIVGRRDGADERPPEELTDFSTYELSVVNTGVTAVQNYKSEHQQELQLREGERENKAQNLAADGANKRAQIISNQQNEINLLNQRSGTASPMHSQLKAKQSHTKLLLDKVQLEIGQRPLRTQLVTLYLPILAILALVEIPINSQAFAFAFTQTPKVAYVLAFGIGVFFIYMAHVCGWTLRISGNETGQKSPRTQFPVVAGAVLFIIVVMYYLAMVRKTYLDFLNDAGGTNKILEDLGLIEIVTESASEWSSVLTDPSALTFLLMNVAVFLVGGFLAFHRHDPHPDFERVVEDDEKVATALEAMATKYSNESVLIQEKYQNLLDSLGLSQKKAEENLQRLDDQIQQIKTQKGNDIQLVRDVVFQELMAYQQSNEEARSTPPPRYFGSQSKAMISESIRD